MTDNVKISFDVAASAPAHAIGLRVLLDNNVVYSNSHIQQDSVEIHAPDDSGDHELTIEMFGKTYEHTQIDSNGTIVSDALLAISNVCFDDIDITSILSEHAVYCHDFNGSGVKTQEQFYGNMGCNGTITMKFSSPVYLWLLEHL
jgi:hypothetical protein